MVDACSKTTRAQWMRFVAVVLMPLSMMGCLGTSPDRPLTTADLKRMAVGRIFNVSLQRIGGDSPVFLGDDPMKMSSRILKSMSPVISSKAAASRDLVPEYVFAFQSGRNPIEFNVRVCGDVLCYRVGDVDYEGGDAEGFLDIAKELIK